MNRQHPCRRRETLTCTRPCVCLLCTLSSRYVHTRLTPLHLSPYSIRSLEFWFNHLYNHEGNTQNPVLSCKLNVGQVSEAHKKETRLSFQMREVGRDPHKLSSSKLGLLPKSFPSFYLC